MSIPEARLKTGFFSQGMATLKERFWVPFITVCLLFVVVHGIHGLYTLYSTSKRRAVESAQHFLKTMYNVDPEDTVCALADRSYSNPVVCWFKDINKKTIKVECVDDVDCAFVQF